MRIRAVKSRLFDRADVLALFCATDEVSTDRALATFGIDPSRELFPQLFARLLRVYRTAIRAHRGEEEVFRALLRLHAIDDPKANRGIRSDRVAEPVTLAVERQASRELLDREPREPLGRKLTRLRLALRKVTKLFNSLQKVVIPRIEHDIRAIVEGLEEEERNEAVRRMIVVGC